MLGLLLRGGGTRAGFLAGALIISPDKLLPARMITRDRRKINRTIDLGYKKVEELEDEIRLFLKQSHQPSPKGQ